MHFGGPAAAASGGHPGGMGGSSSGSGMGVSGGGGSGSSTSGRDVKPHQCQQCLKTFSSNHQLVQHIRVRLKRTITKFSLISILFFNAFNFFFVYTTSFFSFFLFTGAHRRKALQMLILRSKIQAIVPCATTHKTSYWYKKNFCDTKILCDFRL